MADGELVFVTIRGDLDVNEVKLKNALGVNEVRLATDEQVAAARLVAGSASPVGLQGIRRVADPSIQLGANFLAGPISPTYTCETSTTPAISRSTCSRISRWCSRGRLP